MSDDRAIEHLEALRSDIRAEIKQRIEQRDRYSIQWTIVLSALVGLAFSRTGFERALIAAPLASIYFSVLVLYSYKVHGVLAKYLREALEPELARSCGTDAELEWESYYARHEVPGIRKGFFIAALWAVLILTMMYLIPTQIGDPVFVRVLGVGGGVYVLACTVITILFWK